MCRCLVACIEESHSGRRINEQRQGSLEHLAVPFIHVDYSYEDFIIEVQCE